MNEGKEKEKKKGKKKNTKKKLGKITQEEKNLERIESWGN